MNKLPKSKFVSARRSLLLGLAVLTMGSSQAGDEHSSAKHRYVNYQDVVFTDSSRYRDGCKVGNPACRDTTHGFRLIDVRIFRPAKNKGSGDPIRVPLVPQVYNGTYPNQPFVPSTMAFQQQMTWEDNKPIDKPLPLVLLFGGGGASDGVMTIAETIAAAGFIAAVPSAYGVDFDACPIPDFCGPAVARTQERDARVVIDAAQNGLLGFPSGLVKTDHSGLSVVGCAGGSAGGSVCLRATAGASTSDANSLPGETSADPRIRAVFVGDTYLFPSGSFNNTHFTVALATYGSAVFGNWPSVFSLYNTASKRIYYDLTNAEHIGEGDIGINSDCEFASESIRVIQDGVNSLHDNIIISGNMPFLLGTQFSYCSVADLTGFEVLPPPLPSTLPGLLPHVPLSGISIEAGGNFTQMTNHYVTQFLRGILLSDQHALQQAITPSFPGLLNNIYVDAVPGFTGNNFTLQNKQIDIKLDKQKKHYTTTIVPRTGPIENPKITDPDAYSLFGDNDWDDVIAQIQPLAFGKFPFPKGNLVHKTRSIDVNSNGYILPESILGIVDGLYAPNRLQRWFEDRGSWSIACAGTDVASNIVAGDPVGGRIWVSNSKQHLRITWYQVFSFEFGKLVSMQCTLYPDGSVQIVHDGSIPAVLNATTGETGALVVGISSGRLHVNKHGEYDPKIKPRIVTFTDIMNGASTKNADAIFEEYSETRAPQGVQPQPPCQGGGH